MKTIAVIGGNIDFVALLVKLINQYDGVQAISFGYAKDLLASNFDIVLLSSGVSEADEAIIRKQVNQPIIQHYGGGSGLLRAEILPFLA
jgi:7-cyano-7-deazaguanine synthase in queuosine biosynthesis